jgi:hypothetical protein
MLTTHFVIVLVFVVLFFSKNKSMVMRAALNNIPAEEIKLFFICRYYFFFFVFNCYWEKFKFFITAIAWELHSIKLNAFDHFKSLLRMKTKADLNSWIRRRGDGKCHFFSFHSLRFSIPMINNESNNSRATFIIWLNENIYEKLLWDFTLSCVVGSGRKTAGNFLSATHD